MFCLFVVFEKKSYFTCHRLCITSHFKTDFFANIGIFRGDVFYSLTKTSFKTTEMESRKKFYIVTVLTVDIFNQT